MRDGLKRLYWRLIQLILTSETCIGDNISLPYEIKGGIEYV